MTTLYQLWLPFTNYDYPLPTMTTLYRLWLPFTYFTLGIGSEGREASYVLWLHACRHSTQCERGEPSLHETQRCVLSRILWIHPQINHVQYSECDHTPIPLPLYNYVCVCIQEIMLNLKHLKHGAYGVASIQLALNFFFHTYFRTKKNLR